MLGGKIFVLWMTYDDTYHLRHNRTLSGSVSSAAPLRTHAIQLCNGMVSSIMTAAKGNKYAAKPEGEHFVKVFVAVRPDQKEMLDTLPRGTRSEAMRRALDAFFTTHPLTEVDYAAILDAMAAEPDEIYE